MAMPFEAAVSSLQTHRVDSWQTWAGAAQVIQKAAEAGRDLSPILNILRQAYLESHQLPIMEPLARAVTAHYLNRGDTDSLGRLLREPEFASYIVDALGDYRRRLTLKQMAQLLPELAGCQGRWTYLVGLWCQSHPGQSEAMFQAIWNDPTTRAALPGLLTDMVLNGAHKKVNLAPAVPLVLQRVAQDERAAHTLRWLVEADVAMELELIGESPEVERLLAYCYAFDAARRRLYQRVDRPMSAPQRLGATQALCVTLNSRRQDEPALVQRLITRLADEDEEVRKSAYLGLSAALREGLDVLGPLNAPISWTSELERYVYDWMHGDSRRAARVADWNPPERLRRVCQEVVAGRHRWSCTICRYIPRSVHCYHEVDLPKNLSRLLPPGPYDASGQRRCPECGAEYQVSYHEEYDGMRPDIDIQVDRLAPPELNADLLEHFEGYLRQDTAFALAGRAFRSKDWERVRSLLEHPDPEVREHALMAIPALESGELVGVLRRHLDSPRASELLLRYLAKSGQARELAAILATAPPQLALRVLGTLPGQERLEPGPLAPHLYALLSHPDEALRRRAVDGLTWLGQRGHETAVQLQRLRQLLDHSDPETRRQALRGLQDLVPQWGDQAEILRAAVTHSLETDRENRYSSLAVLSRAAGKYSVEGSFQALVEVLLEDQEGYADDAGIILRDALHRGQFRPELVEALAPGWKLGDTERNLVSECYQVMLQRGVDLTPIQSQLVEAMLSDRVNYVESYFISHFTRFLVRQGRLDAELLGRFLRARSEISGGCGHALAEEVAKRNLDLAPLVPVLAQMLANRHWYTADGARQALEAQARRHGKARVLAALAGVEASEARTRLETALAGP